VCVGCADLHSARSPLALRTPIPPDQTAYRIACPDVLEVQFPERPHENFVVAVDVDGTITLASDRRVRVATLTTQEAALAIAETLRTHQPITVTLAAGRSARIFITGPDNRRVREYPYTGPVSALDLLQHSGAIQPRATKLNDVYLVRPHIADAKTPSVFAIDLEAAVWEGDTTSDVMVQPGDHLYVGETRRASFVRLLPPWLQPLYRNVLGLMPDWERLAGKS
jgi:polysaccharide biosynthesis/export protein